MLNLTAGYSHIQDLAFSPDGTTLVAAHPGGMFVCRGLPTPVCTPREGHRAVFLPGTARVLLVGESATLCDLATGDEVPISFGPGYVPMAAATPDGKFVLFTRHVGWNGAVLFARATDNLTNNTAAWSVKLKHPVLGPPLVTPDAQRCLVAESEGSYGFREYEVATGRLLRSWKPQPPAFGRWLLTPDGQRLIGSRQGCLCVVDLARPEHETVVVRNKSWRDSAGIALHPSGRWLAVWHSGPTVKLYDTESWKAVQTYSWKVGKVKSVGFAPDGSRAAAGGHRGKVVVWDFAT